MEENKETQKGDAPEQRMTYKEVLQLGIDRYNSPIDRGARINFEPNAVTIELPSGKKYRDQLDAEIVSPKDYDLLCEFLTRKILLEGFTRPYPVGACNRDGVLLQPVEQFNIHQVNRIAKTVDTNLISDGYHTFGELYEHRIELFIALCRRNQDIAWKSLTHSDGSSIEGWFLMGLYETKGEQITYHLPMSY